MPFLISYKNSDIERIRNKKKITGKEHDSVLAHHKKCFLHTHRERASAFTSKGSMTVEAALVAPIFFFAALALVYLLEMMSLQTTIRAALHSVGREIAAERYKNTLPIPYLVETKMVETIGEARLNNSWIYHGSKGLDCNSSQKWWKGSVMYLSVRYQIQFPVAMFHIPIISREETLRVKEWTGYSGTDFGAENEEKVYITDTGMVYHKDPECTYLDLSIHCVGKNSILERKNFEGERYAPCERCVQEKATGEKWYITNTGNRYHNSLQCSGLKRTVYAVFLSEIYAKGGCARCVK